MDTLYVPVANPAALMDAVIGSVSVVVVPDAGERVNQAALSVTDQVNVPVPGFAMFNIIEAGFEAP